MTIDHDAIAARVRQDNTLGLNICAAYLDLHDEVTRLRAERERLLYVLDGVAGAIDTGRNEPLQVWRDQINIARQALKGQPK